MSRLRDRSNSPTLEYDQIADSMRRLLDAEPTMSPEALARMRALNTKEQLALRLLDAEEAARGR